MSRGIMKDADVQVGALTNINSNLIRFQKEKVIKVLANKIQSDGYRFHEYVVGTPFDGERMRYSTTDINDGRQSFGIYQTLSFIQEGKRYGDVENKIKKRTVSQLVSLRHFLEIIASNASEIVRLVSQSRKQLLHSPLQQRIIQMEHYPSAVDSVVIFPVFDLYQWKHTSMTLKPFHPVVKPRKSVREPVGYLIPDSLDGLIDLLKRHQIVMEKPPSSPMRVETYTIKHITDRMEEELKLPCYDLKKEIKPIPDINRYIYSHSSAGQIMDHVGTRA